jgi:hypothetical protein
VPRDCSLLMPKLWERNLWLGKLDCPFFSSPRTKFAVGSEMIYLDDREWCSRIAEFKEKERRFVAEIFASGVLFHHFGSVE